MRTLGVDYGRKKIGLAIAESLLAEPFKVLKVENQEAAVKKIEQIVKVEQIEQIVIGISEGKMGEETKEFSSSLKAKLALPVEEIDETLTTHDAQVQSIEAGMNRKKRHYMEDSFSAAIILQKFLDSK